MWNLCRQLLTVGFATIVVLSGCARGIPEFRYYEEAYRLQSRLGDSVLDNLAQAERKSKPIIQLTEERSNQVSRFRPEYASYILTVGDPPITASIRNSLNSISQLNLALIGLAQGESVNVLNQRANEALTFLSHISTSSSLGLTGSTLTIASGDLLPVLRQLAQVEGRVKFEKIFLKAYPDIRKLLATVRTDITPLIFEVHRKSVSKVGDLETRTELSGRNHPQKTILIEPIDEQGLAYLESVRKQLAAWVILLEQTELAMDRAVAALRGESLAFDQTALATASNDLRALAKALEMELNSEPNRG